MRYHHGLFLSLFTLLFSLNAIAQQADGVVEYRMDTSVTWLLEKYKTMNERQPMLEGYRIQLVARSGANARKDAEQVRARFMSQYPAVPAYLIPQLPNFKVRIGNFRDRYTAYRFYKKLKQEYPSAFIVRDQILPPFTTGNPQED